MTTYDVLVGFSVNPEITLRPEGGERGQKRACHMDIELSGTSFDVAVALKRAGAQPFLIGAVGVHDAFNGWIDQQLQNAALAHYLMGVRQQTALAVIEPSTAKHWSYKPSFRSDFESLSGHEATVLQHYLPATVDIKHSTRVVTGLQAYEHEVELARTMLGGPENIRVLNPRESLVRDWNKFQPLLERTDWLVLNRHEARAFHPRYERIGPRDFLQFGPSVVVMTHDSDGAEIITRDGFSLHVPAYSFGEVVHETGAGDCLLGYFIAGRLNGWSWEKSLRMAVIAAGIKVTRHGTAASPMLDEVQRCYDKVHGLKVLP